MGGVDQLQDALAPPEHALSLARMHGGGRHQAQAGVVMLVIAPGKELFAPGAGIQQAAKEIGEGGVTLYRLELRFQERVVLSSGVCGRDKLWVTPRSVNSASKGSAVIGPPRSVWMCNWLGGMFWRAQHSAMSCSARLAHCRSAISQPTTKRLKRS